MALGVVAMKIAGLDFSKIDLSEMKHSDLNIIYNAFLSNIELASGALNRDPKNQLIEYLRRYIEINLLCNTSTDRLINRAVSHDLLLAMSIYMLPEDSKKPLIKKYAYIISNLNCSKEIYMLREQPFELDLIYKISGLLKSEEDKLNITGFVDHDVKDLYDQVCDQLLISATAQLDRINNSFSYTPLEIATKVIFYIEILRYLEGSKNDYNYKILMTMYYYKEYNLLSFKNKVLDLLRKQIQQLNYMPDYNSASMMQPHGALLFRCFMHSQKDAQDHDLKKSKRVHPEL